MRTEKVKVVEFIVVGEDNIPGKKYGVQFPHKRHKYAGPGAKGGEPPLTGKVSFVSHDEAYLFPTSKKAEEWVTKRNFVVVQ